MQVVNLLPPVAARVAYYPKPALWVWASSLLKGQLRCQDHHAPHHLGMLRPNLCHGGEMYFGNYQEMDRSPGVDVVKSQKLLILENLFRRNGATHYFAKQALGVRMLRHIQGF